MLGGRQLALLLAIFVVLVPVSDPRGPDSSSRKKLYIKAGGDTAGQSCKEKIAACGEFPTGGEAQVMKCKLRTGPKKDRCQVYCSFSCKQGMKRSTPRRQGPYECVNGKWEWIRPSTAKGYCIPDDLLVREVHQNSLLHEKMNKLIKELLMSSYEFVAMASFYRRADVALPGFKNLMADLAEKDSKFAQDMIAYEIERGESLHLQDIDRPTSYEDLLMYLDKRTGKAGLEKALAETKNVNAYVTEIVQQADAHRKHFLEDSVLDYKTNTIKKLVDLHSTLEKFETDEDYFIGEYRMDLELRE